MSGSADQSLPHGAEAADGVGERARHEKVLLEEAQALALRRRVVRVEHAGQRLGRQRLGQRAHEVAAAELLEVEEVRRGGRPETKRVHRPAAVADDRPIVGTLSLVNGIVGILFMAFGALLFVLRDRLGAQAKAQGHGVTPLAYGVVGAILFAFGAFYALNAT